MTWWAVCLQHLHANGTRRGPKLLVLINLLNWFPKSTKENLFKLSFFLAFFQVSKRSDPQVPGEIRMSKWRPKVEAPHPKIDPCSPAPTSSPSLSWCRYSFYEQLSQPEDDT
jgi:hypothetical protein